MLIRAALLCSVQSSTGLPDAAHAVRAPASLRWRASPAQVQAGQLPLSEAAGSAAADDKLLEHFCAAQPVLCNVRYSVCMSL